MAGNSNSGRRPIGDTQKRRKIIDKAWDTVEEYLNNTSIELKYRAEMASKLCVKDIPQEITGGEGEPLVPPTIIFEYKKNDSPNVHAEQSAGGTESESPV
jgi:hypothetical protein